ncbi:hypothetical protein [Acidithiobacillus albertensis]|uniref:hypothetical protein n=1 Tax=Acidithiobacillus albertensis TaxID=119978 RepID=UPI001C066B63|nr:hypothetical protein [Acidithiobacillus albertensis]MBU2743358.1 hypothetical protein [Acidithiobacillus albertensis]
MKGDPLIYLSPLECMALMLVEVDFRDHPAAWNEALYDTRIDQTVRIMEAAVKAGALLHRSHNMFGYVMPPSDALDDDGNVRTDTWLALSDVWRWRKDQGVETTKSPEALAALFKSVCPGTQVDVTPENQADGQKVIIIKKRDGALKLPTRAQLDEWQETFPFAENVGRHKACIAFAGWLKIAGYMEVTDRTLETWFDWNDATWKLEPNAKALQRGFETNGVEAS